MASLVTAPDLCRQQPRQCERVNVQAIRIVINQALTSIWLGRYAWQWSVA
jgi:hypothetical protein